MQATTERAERVDSQRNRQRVLDAADRLLADRGISVTLGEIATEAGVGAGTVYRHFPTKDALMALVLDQRVAQVVDRAKAVVDGREPGEAFFDFLRYATDQAMRNRGLCEALATRGEWQEPSKMVGECVISSPVGVLLERAQRAGAVREGLDVGHVLALIPAYVGLAQSLGSPERTRDLAEMLWDGLRPPLERNSAIDNETLVESVARNETGADLDNETGRCCPVCGDPIAVSATGRPPKYCSAACRQKAFRDKRKAAA
ncbi:TetR/AcrR family transcriptional regulator [Glycomyces buryatensis]|uniref:TetR/AcrR family transcriptional regulator n=1 Tax=Glycomyces buryatensis TaxID=2570927 RepID=A0A4S8QBL2_9ACTN|nr:TetR/AcrR family transcriptional regulator [Glycomyces buryatensis]THV38429.1 TetR/AcrR family transcriptional regulator [Glycomyces buryatensis]